MKRQVLDRVRIEDVVGEHVALRRRGTRLVALCPFHSEKTPSFTVNPDRGTFKCFGCGKGGDVFSFLTMKENLPFMEAMRLLADRAGVRMPSRGSAPAAIADGPSRTDLLKINAWAAQFFRASLAHDTIGRSAREYLRGRGFTDSSVQAFGLGLAVDGTVSLRAAATKAGIHEGALLAADLLRSDEGGRTYDTFRQRLMFPIRDASARVVGFGGRTLVDDKAKYLNTRQTSLFDKGRLLYGIDAAREAISKAGRAVLVEGYTDCIACHQAGFPEAVATLGTALTEHHVELLRRFVDRLVLLFDSDAAGEAAADRAIALALPRCLDVRLARIPEGKDPGEFLPRAGAGAFSDVLKDAVDALEFKWFATRQRFEADTSDARRREAVLDFVRVVADAVSAAAVDAIRYGLLVNQVAHLLGIERTEVARLMERSRPKRPGAPTKPSDPAAAEATVRTGEQAVWTHLLEVLLNCPELAATLAERPDVRRIADARDRRIAEALFAAADEGTGLAFADVLGRCLDPADSARATELVERGAGRGNYQATLALALERLSEAQRDTQTEVSRRRLLQSTESGPATDSADAERVLSDAVREHRHYVPRRLRRRIAVAVNPNADQNDDVSSVVDKTVLEPT